jgi:hypothetical protein
VAATRRPSVRLSSAVGAVLLAAALTGCSATNPITTQDSYAASDGVQVEIGDVQGENLLLVAAEADAPGALQGALTNFGDDTVTVSISTDGDAEQIRVRAGETVLIGGTEGEDVVLSTPDAPGALTTLTLSSGPGGTQEVRVPVLDGTLPEYADLVPDAA